MMLLAFMAALGLVLGGHAAQVRAAPATRVAASGQEMSCPNPACCPAGLDPGQKDHVLLIPTVKLAFCVMQKVASSEMIKLFNAANGLLQEGEGDLASTPMELGINVSIVTRQSGWKFAFFTRDPLERYLSAFFSKCMPDSSGHIDQRGLYCCGPTVPGGILAGAASEVSAFEERALADAWRGHSLNDHWLSQVDILKRCGLENFNPEDADFVGQLSGDVNSQMKSMLRMVQFADAEKLVDQYFPKTPKRHKKSKSASNKSQLNAFYRKATIASTVQDLYQEDYATLNISRAMSLHSAHGF